MRNRKGHRNIDKSILLGLRCHAILCENLTEGTKDLNTYKINT